MAIAWASMVTTVAFEMVVPALLGHWLDKQWGTAPWLVLVGTILGFSIGMLHLMRWSAKLKKDLDEGDGPSDVEPGNGE